MCEGCKGVQPCKGCLDPPFMAKGVTWDADIFIAGSTGHLGSTEDRAPSPIVMFGRGPSLTSTPISIKIMEESSMELGGSTSTLPSGDRAVFPDSERVSAATASSSVALTITLVELCGIESTPTLKNFVEFRWRNLWQSMIYRSPVKFGRESGRV